MSEANHPTPEKRIPPEFDFRGRRDITDEQYLAKLYSLCVPGPKGCKLWTGWCNVKGYGQMSYRGENWATHRLIYTVKIGPIPPGMLVCHSCDERKCCNENHLFLGTEADNNRDCGNKGRHHNSVKTHCKRGHEFTFENTYLKVTATTVMRACLECQKIRMNSPKYKEKSRERARRKRERIRLKRFTQENHA